MPRTYKRKHNANEIFKFILDFKESNDGISPTLREIGDECGITSISVVKTILERLERQGKIYLEGNYKTRMIKVIGGRWMPPGRPS